MLKRQGFLKGMAKVICAVLLTSVILTNTIANMSMASSATALNPLGQSVSEFEAHALTTGEKEDEAKRINYELSLPSDIPQVVMPIKVDQAGVLQVFFAEESNNVDVSFYSDASCVTPIEYSQSDAFGYIPKAGTYFVKFTNSYGDYGAEDVVDIKASFSCQLYPQANELPNSKWCSVGIKSELEPVYLKFVVNNTAEVALDFKAQNTYAKVTLLDANKKSITSEMSFNSLEGKKVFVLKKGTYYYKITTNAWWIKLKNSNKSVTDQSGVSKAKATALTIGKEKSGFFLLEDKTNQSDWFKFTLNKATPIDFIISGSASAGYIRYELTSTSIDGTLKGYLDGVGTYDKKELIYYKNNKIYNSLPAGTYYVRVYKDSPTTCGNYYVNAMKR